MAEPITQSSGDTASEPRAVAPRRLSARWTFAFALVWLIVATVLMYYIVKLKLDGVEAIRQKAQPSSDVSGSPSGGESAP